MEQELIFQHAPVVSIANVKFENVPVILRYEDVNLIEVVKQSQTQFTTQIPIYSSDGTYLAKVNGNRIYPTQDGKDAGIEVRKHQDVWVCTMNKQTLFEIQQESGDAFRTTAELFTPDGCFVKCAAGMRPNLLNTKGESLTVGGVTFHGAPTIQNFHVGIWLYKNGACAIGCNLPVSEGHG